MSKPFPLIGAVLIGLVHPTFGQTSRPLDFVPGPIIQLPANARPTDVAVADFDRDGRPDLAITENGLDSLVIFRQRPGGTFAARPDSRFGYPNSVVSVVALPLIYGPPGSPPPPADALAVYTGADVYFLDNFHNAQGTLTPRRYRQFYTGGYVYPLIKARLQAALMDGDDYVDLVGFIDTSLRIIGGMTMPGDGGPPSLVRADMTTLPNNIPGLSLGSFNTPGRLDAIVPDPVRNSVWVVRNTTSRNALGRWWSSFGVQDYPSGGIRPVSAAAADVDGDGAADLAAANATSGNVVISLLPQGIPTLITLPLPGAPPQQVELTDLNGDGRPDVVVLTTDGLLWLYRNTGLPGTAAIDPQPVNALASVNPAYLRIADVNNDGRPDLLVPALTNNTVHIFYNQSAPLAAAAAAHAPHVQVYPNPAQTELRLQKEGVDVSAITLVDALARPVRSWPASADVLSVADLPRGLYVLRLTTRSGVVNKRIMLQ